MSLSNSSLNLFVPLLFLVPGVAAISLALIFGGR